MEKRKGGRFQQNVLLLILLLFLPVCSFLCAPASLHGQRGLHTRPVMSLRGPPTSSQSLRLPRSSASLMATGPRALAPALPCLHPPLSTCLRPSEPSLTSGAWNLGKELEDRAAS